MVMDDHKNICREEKHLLYTWHFHSTESVYESCLKKTITIVFLGPKGKVSKIKGQWNFLLGVGEWFEKFEFSIRF